MHTPEEIGKTLKRLREASGLNQTELAERSSVIQPNISKIENGAYGVLGVEIAHALASALGVTTSELIGEKQPENDPHIREMNVIMEPLPEYDKRTVIGAAKGIIDALKKTG
jgi:transcriptional regulator with XRE-family HTH domain